MVNRFKTFALFFFLEMLTYFLVVANTRAFTQGHYGWTALTDLVFASVNFWMLQRIAEDKNARSLWAGAGFVLGGTLGSLISIWVTKHLYGA